MEASGYATQNFSSQQLIEHIMQYISEMNRCFLKWLQAVKKAIQSFGDRLREVIVSDRDKPDWGIFRRTKRVEEEPDVIEMTPFEEADIIEKSVSDIAQEVIAGHWGVGQARRNLLSEAGYDPREIEREVVRLRNKL